MWNGKEVHFMITKKLANSVRTTLLRNLRYLIVSESSDLYVGFAKSLKEANNMVKIACETKPNPHNKTHWREDYYFIPIEQSSYYRLRRFIIDMLDSDDTNSFTYDEKRCIADYILEYYQKRYFIG